MTQHLLFKWDILSYSTTENFSFLTYYVIIYHYFFYQHQLLLILSPIIYCIVNLIYTNNLSLLFITYLEFIIDNG